MKKTASIMFRVGLVYNIIMLVIFGLIFFIAFIETMVGVGVSSDSYYYASFASMLGTGLVFTILLVISLIASGSNNRKSNYNPTNKNYCIGLIIAGAIGLNPFYIASGILRLVMSNRQQSTTQSRPQPRSQPRPQPRPQSRPQSQSRPQPRPQSQSRNGAPGQAGQNGQPGNARPNKVVEAPVVIEDSSGKDNAYGDIIISYKEFRNMVTSNNFACISMGKVEMASSSGSFNFSGMSLNNNIMSVEINGVKRTYDTNEGVKGILVQGNDVYLAIQDSIYNEKYADGSEEIDPVETTKKFDLFGIRRVMIKTKSADIDITPTDEEKCEVACADGFESSIGNGILSIDGSNCDKGIEIAIPNHRRDLIIEINGASCSIDIAKIVCSNLKVNITSGNLDADISTRNLYVNVTSGSADINHVYYEDGSATLNTTSGSIDYSVENVKIMNVSAEGEYDDNWEASETGFEADVTVSSTSGSISID